MSHTLLFLLFFTCLSVNAAITPAESTDCIDCHQQQVKNWQLSDHAKAMNLATATHVVGNFDNQSITYAGQVARFYKKNNEFWVSLTHNSNPNQIKHHKITYTFGHFPLQQYLVDTKRGKKQVLPYTWDARSKEEGGQRWYHLHENEQITEKDRFHWLQPLQNWNGMCADCHSDGLARNYNLADDSFDTTWIGINVGCVSCHASLEENHHKIPTTQPADLQQELGLWLRNQNEDVAQWRTVDGKIAPARDNQFMDRCFNCHALRSPLENSINGHAPFLDNFTPQFLLPNLYHADGQISEEVYVYGSFMQSKMAKAGVNCIDCHNPHTMKVKTQTNGLCLQCHSAETYEQEKHHGHSTESSGAQCINCHMPENRYIGVDDRRDHSFRIPRPDLAATFATPNACTNCHENKSNQWAASALEKWHGKPEPVTTSQLNYMKLQRGQYISLAQQLAVASEPSVDVMKRATTLAMLPYTQQTLHADHLKSFVLHSEPLIKLAAAQASVLVPARQRVNLISPLLTDKLKAIRVAAAQALLEASSIVANQQAYFKAYNELVISQEVSAWRGEGQLNIANRHITLAEYDQAEKALIQAIAVEPYMDMPYINLADLYRAQNKEFQAGQVIAKGINNVANSAALYYAKALHLIRVKQPQNALPAFAKAYTLEPQNAQYLYAYALGFDGINQPSKAIELLNKHKTMVQTHQGLSELYRYLIQKTRGRASY